MYEDLRAEAEVNGCSIGKVLELKLAMVKDLMACLAAPPGQKPPASTGEDLDAQYEEMVKYQEYWAKVEAQKENNRKNYLAHKFIAQRKAIEAKMKKAEVAK